MGELSDRLIAELVDAVRAQLRKETAERLRDIYLIGDIEKMFPQVEQLVAASDFGRDAISKARVIVDKARQAIAKKDVGAVREQLAALARTRRLFKGVVARPQG